MNIKIDMVIDKETKGSVRYQEIYKGQRMVPSDPEAKVGILYIRKLVLGENIPSRITVTIGDKK